jgi:uncharacterized membrane protein
MNHWWFLLRLRHKPILAAIAQAEKQTSGEVRVFISHKPCTNAYAEAVLQFEKLGMTATAERNGVLFFIAPRSRTFAVVGDTGIHSRCGESFWTTLAATLSGAFKTGRLTSGLVEAIQTAGQLLAEHFPIGHEDRNELPNDIVTDA